MKQIIFLIAASSLLLGLDAKNEKQIVDLRGNWKFEIGDEKKYAAPNFDDSKWTEIFVPADWENEGFPGYDGYAWYRKSFTIPASAQNKLLSLHLGYVDDVCAVYVNGNLIGIGGQFPPTYETAYNQELQFNIPKKYLNYGQNNTIAVRVYDDHLNGGIVKGKVGIVEYTDAIRSLVTFSDLWKFKTGDNMDWKNPMFDDSRWQDLIVPALWDFQGYRDYDGFAWYRTTFDVPSDLKTENLILMLGKIDDIDEAYLNGELIGKTGRIRGDGSVSKIRKEYSEIREYTIPATALQRGKKNVLAVRVYDDRHKGGIYEGPVGIVTEKEYDQWSRTTEQERTRFENPVDRFFENIFNR